MWLNNINQIVNGIFFGSIPLHYATAHNKIHHFWHNHVDDVTTNIDLDRSSFYSILVFFPRFLLYWTGITPLLLFYKKQQHDSVQLLATGMAIHLFQSFCLYQVVGFKVWFYFVFYPFIEAVAFMGNITYLWHAFVDEDDPANQYVNSMTIVEGHDNIWNEDNHVIHHHVVSSHWTECPEIYAATKHELKRKITT